MGHEQSLGLGLAVATAVCWAISPLCFASAGRRVGSLPVALVRILLAAVVLAAALPGYYVATGIRFEWPTGMQVLWLAASAFSGIAIGDILTYESLVTLGPRRTTQLYTLGPVASVSAGFLAGEALSLPVLVGVGIVLVATSYAVFNRPEDPGTSEPGKMTVTGLMYGAFGAIFTGLGAVATRQAFRVGPALDPFLATTLRVGLAAGMMWLIPVMRRNVGETIGILRNREAAVRVLAGTVAGPLTGMVCYVTALKYTQAGLVSTIVATSPLLVLPYITLRYRARLGWSTPVAAGMAVVGIAILSDPGLVGRVVQRLGH